MTKTELIESLIAVNSKNVDAKAATERIFRIYGSYNAVVEAGRDDIAKLSGITVGSAELISIIPGLARRVFSERIRDVRDLSNCAKACEYLRMTYLGHFNEMMYVLALDDDGMLINRKLVQEGTIDETSVYVRKIMECALLSDASALIISHNHPGGTFEISLADSQCTKLVSRVVSQYGITLVDHIIIADGKAHSMALMGEMPARERKVPEKVQKLLSEWVSVETADEQGKGGRE